MIKEKNSTSKDPGGKSTQFPKIARKKVVKFSSIRFGVASSLALEKIYEKSTQCSKNLWEEKKSNQFSVASLGVASIPLDLKGIFDFLWFLSTKTLE